MIIAYRPVKSRKLNHLTSTTYIDKSLKISKNSIRRKKKISRKIIRIHSQNKKKKKKNSESWLGNSVENSRDRGEATNGGGPELDLSFTIASVVLVSRNGRWLGNKIAAWRIARGRRWRDLSSVSVWPDREISRGTAVVQGVVCKGGCTCS